MLAKWDLFRDLRNVEDEFDRLAGRAYSRDTWVPALDVRESEDRWEVTLDLPGLDPGDVSVTFEDGMLSITVLGALHASPAVKAALAGRMR